MVCSCAIFINSSILISTGEVEEEPEVDLTEFLARQRLGDSEKKGSDVDDKEVEIDTSLAHLSSKFNAQPNTFKGKVQYVDWDDSTEEMFREAAAADANRGLSHNSIAFLVGLMFLLRVEITFPCEGRETEILKAHRPTVEIF